MSPPGDRISASFEGEDQPRPMARAERLVVIGNFDGVHRGHQAVLRAAAEEASARGLELCVLTFDPHPAKVLAGKERPALTVTERKVRLLEAVAPQVHVEVQHFDLALAALSPEEFARRILSEKLRAKVVLVGENFRFGKGRAGDLGTLRELGERLGFEARSEPLRGDGEGAFSSTRVRELLKEGRVGEANEILGRPHAWTGFVKKGDERGRTLGFPTANLRDVREACPKGGVYVVHVFDLSHGEGAFLAAGVANIGARPTVERPASHEVHLLDYSGDLYGKSLGIACLGRLRETVKFADVEELKGQIARDVQEARKLLSTVQNAPNWRAL